MKPRFKKDDLVVYVGKTDKDYKYNRVYLVTKAFVEGPIGYEVDRINTLDTKTGETNGWCAEYFRPYPDHEKKFYETLDKLVNE